MQTNSKDEEFARLSAECRRHLKAGMLDWFAFDLKSMGALLGREGRYADKLKVLMLAFYIELSGEDGRSPFIDDAVVAGLRDSAERTRLTKYQIDELYMEIVREDVTPSHCMTVKDSLYLLELCMKGDMAEADAVLENIRK